MATTPMASSTTPHTHSGLRAFISRHPLISYFIGAYALMWLFAVPLALSHDQGSGLLSYEVSEDGGNLLFLLATFSGPTIAALLVTGISEGRQGLLRLLKRTLQWRVAPRWYLIVVSINLLIWLLAYSVLLGPQLLLGATTHWSLLLSTFLPLVAFGIFIPSIAEEPGWRGFALPRLQQRYGPIVASLVLGAFHAFWHLPALFTINFGPLPLDNLLPFLLTAVAATFLYTWVYNHTGGSVLLAILLHASSNAASQWLQVLMDEAGLSQPVLNLGGWLLPTIWINVIAYGLVMTLLLIATRGRLGYSAPTSDIPNNKQ